MPTTEMLTINPALVALAGFAGWTALLLLTIANVRMANVFTGKKAINAFSPTGNDLPGFGQRITRAHLNCVETLPIFAALVVAAGLSGQFAIMEGTAMYVLYARIGQSIGHLISTSPLMVWVRAGFFFVQVLLLGWYAIQLVF